MRELRKWRWENHCRTKTD